MKPCPLVIFSALFLLLLSATTANLVSTSVILRAHNPGCLAEVLPRDVGEWSSQDASVAETEEGKRKTIEQLSYDQAVVRIYEHSGVKIAVYAAYWGGGGISPRMVASHTPDSCWVLEGWVRKQAVEYSRTLNDGLMVVPARYRVFEKHGNVQHVLYWHFVDRKLFYYKEPGELPPWWAVFYDITRFRIGENAEQLVLRISSNVPIEQVWLADPVQFVIRSLRHLGLSAQADATP